MTNTEILRTLSRMMGALREHAPAGEVTYQCGDGWRMCDRIEGTGGVTNLYTYPGEPQTLYPLKVTLWSLGRSYTVKIESEKETCNA